MTALLSFSMSSMLEKGNEDELAVHEADDNQKAFRLLMLLAVARDKSARN